MYKETLSWDGIIPAVVFILTFAVQFLYCVEQEVCIIEDHFALL